MDLDFRRDDTMKKLLLIDANSIIHRSFHALPPFTGPAGEPTGALYGIASILLRLWRDEKPEYAAALFDRPEPTFRKKEYAEYKAQRPPAPDELVSQIIEARHLFEAFGIKTFEKPGFEADDLIATLAERFKAEPDTQVVILTGDRDTLQLIENDKVVVRTFNKGVSDTTIYDEKAVMEKYGFAPAQMVDYKALVGDPSDNIKGVLGVGPKTATELIKKFGNIEEIWKAVPADPKLSARLGGREEEAKFSKKLVLLERNVPLGLSTISELETSDTTLEIEQYFQKEGFVTLLKRFEKGSGSLASPLDAKGKKEKPPSRQQAMF
jgi:DNA polymerase-1